MEQSSSSLSGALGGFETGTGDETDVEDALVAGTDLFLVRPPVWR